MSTTNEPRAKNALSKHSRSWPSRDGVFRFTLDQYNQLDQLGFFEDRRVELIRRLIYEMTRNTPHATAARLASHALRAIFGVGWVVSEVLPLDTGRRSLLEPDFSVAAGSIRDFALVHTKTAALVVEIGDATLRKDRTIKAHLHAQAGLSDYWIVNLIDRQLEVHREPVANPSRRGRFRYANVTIVPESGRIAHLAAPGSSVAVADLLP